jgi:hypothetical protein
MVSMGMAVGIAKSVRVADRTSATVIGLRWRGFRLGLRLRADGIAETVVVFQASSGVWGYPEGESKFPSSMP